MHSPPPLSARDREGWAAEVGGSPRLHWSLDRREGTADEFHRRDPDPDGGHELWVQRIPGPALILGSTQPEGIVRADRARADGIEVCRRRSGGGLVYLDPRTDCWIDAIVPAGSPLWHDDVGVAFHWLGELWAAALNQSLGPAGPAQVVRPRPGRPVRSRPLWCFSSLGHGEVTIGASKVVGLSQRRTRHWIRLQSLVLGAWPGRRLLPYLDLDPDDGRGDGDEPMPAHVDPSKVRAGPPLGIRLPDPDALADAFLAQARGVDGR